MVYEHVVTQSLDHLYPLQLHCLRLPQLMLLMATNHFLPMATTSVSVTPIATGYPRLIKMITSYQSYSLSYMEALYVVSVVPLYTC